MDIQVRWLPSALVAAASIWIFAFLDVKISAQVTLYLEEFSIILMLVLTAVIFATAVPLAIGAVVLLTGIFYIIVSYAQSVGFGLDAAGVKDFSTSSAPLGDLAKKFMSTSLSE